MFKVTKTYGHNLGLSCCFRQWRASSHCRFIHGYALSVRLTFGAYELNENNWVIDFGGLKPVKQWLCDTFDHKMLVAIDDPAIDFFYGIAGSPEGFAWDEQQLPQLADVIILPAVGCEAFAAYIFANVASWLRRQSLTNPVQLLEVEVREHGANGASVTEDHHGTFDLIQ